MVALAAFGLYQFHKARQQRQIAEQMFYTMKGLDLEIANLQETVAASNNPQTQQQLRAIEDRRHQMEDNYDHFLASMRVYSPKMSEQDRLILRVARIFGECELDMPDGFKSEVERYIKYWQTSGRWKPDLLYAQQNGYVDVIASTLKKQGLPPQFMYIAMNEGNFHQDVSGPITSYGIPKGMWQFLPSAAVHYGLHVGPLLDEQVPDEKDDRDHFDLETGAAAKYLKDLYSGDAQASGLLVLACYDMGEPRVVRMVRSMPANPRERNFWKVLQTHRDQIPQETYDYVFRIVAAAVIGENPRLFGYNFDPPLTHAQG
ncbi:MAG: transglycosylase SLT domain-containing protein [Terriglobus roseus]|nr:transglycosylase SLT domain-containing protein [Terriglobus roseus]